MCMEHAAESLSLGVAREATREEELAVAAASVRLQDAWERINSLQRDRTRPPSQNTIKPSSIRFALDGVDEEVASVRSTTESPKL